MTLSREAVPRAVAIGFAFGSGAFQAMVEDRPGIYTLHEIAVGRPPAGSLDAASAMVGHPAFALDVRRLPDAIAAWFRVPRITRELGALYGSEEATHLTIVPAARYDALIFLARTTRARPAATARRGIELDG